VDKAAIHASAMRSEAFQTGPTLLNSKFISFISLLV